MEGHHAIDMVVHAGQDGCSRWRANTVGDITVIEAYPLVGDPVEVWRLVDSSSIAGYGFRGVVISHNEDNVGSLRPYISGHVGLQC